MANVKVLEEYCKSCGLCVSACPREALKIGRHLNSQGFNPVVFDEAAGCAGCGNCTVVCPDAALELYARVEAAAAAKTS